MDSLSNSVIGCYAGNPIMGYIVQQLGKHFGECHGEPYQKTGPFWMDQVLRWFPITVFPYDYCYPIYWVGKDTNRHINALFRIVI